MAQGERVTRLQEVEVEALDAARLEPLIGPARMARFEQIAAAAQQALEGRTVLNINSTATGGGVAEMLQTLLAYVRGAGVDARWLVIEGDPDFFAITKRIHNGLYGSSGDGGELGAAERRHYERVMRRNADGLVALVRPGDVALVHDPQPAGLSAALAAAGARVLWRCHVGSDTPNEWTRRAWDFLRPYLEQAEAYIVSRPVSGPALGRCRARACCAAVDRPLLRQERADVPPQGAAGARLRGAHRRGWCAAGRAVPAARRLAGPDQPARRHDPERAARPAGRADGHPGLALGSDERHGRCDGGVRRACRSLAGSAPRFGRPGSHWRRG
jgi:trehalose synthase